MAKGKVKWFNNAKGYGFVLPEDGDGDLFAHYSSIQMEGYKTLKAGQEVEFDILKGPKGQHAINIRRVATDDEESPHSLEPAPGDPPEQDDIPRVATDDEESPHSLEPAPGDPPEQDE